MTVGKTHIPTIFPQLLPYLDNISDFCAELFEVKLYKRLQFYKYYKIKHVHGGNIYGRDKKTRSFTQN